jgi:adenylosuccinate synthase
MTNRIAILGAQWGDEGKGGITAQLARDANYVVRTQGGDNAGHTLYTEEGKKIVVNIAPSGVIYPHVTNVIGNGCVVNLETLAQNIEGLNPKLYLSDAAHLILNWHRSLDNAKEHCRNGGSLGTTNRGIGPAYMDKMQRTGIRLGELRNLARLEERIRTQGGQKNKELQQLYGFSNAIDLDVVWQELKPLAQRFAPLVTDTSMLLHDAIQQKKRILFEGAQAAMLDIDHGTYPYVTSSNTTIGGILTGTGLGLNAVQKVIGVAKAYTTRVGEGIFLTETEPYNNIKQLTKDSSITHREKAIVRSGNPTIPEYDRLVSRYIREVAEEYGATTGRPRRVGWLDLVILEKAARINGLNSLALTRLDCLDGIGTIKVCTKYKNKNTGESISHFPNDISVLEELEPVYVELPGWRNSKGITRFRDLPKEAKRYIHLIEDHLALDISLIKNGCGLNDYIERKKSW